MPAAESTPFELRLHGGAPERRYRKLRPGVSELPWDSIDPEGLSAAGFSATELAAARGGWTSAALQEYASASAQASLLRALVRARVPLDLSGMAAGFPLDELVHAELCARMAEVLGGGTGVPCGDRYFPSPPNRDDPLLEAAELVVWNCCVSESWSTAMLREVQKRAQSELAVAIWGQIAKDETLHGQFGWVFLDWLEQEIDGGLGASDRLALARTASRVVHSIRQNIAQMAKAAPAQFCAIGVLPGFDPESFQACATAALERVVLAPLRAHRILPDA